VLRGLGGELFKSWKRPAVWVCIIGLLAVAVTIGYAIPWVFETFPPPGSTRGLPEGTTLADFKVALYPANFVLETVQQWSLLGGVFALILGVLAQGSEYGWGTIKTLYTQREGRLAMLWGKIAALAIVVLVLVVALFAATAVASAIIATIDAKSISYPGAEVIAKGISALFLIHGFWALFGFLLATLFRQSAMAIGLGLAYALVIEGIILGFAGQFAGWLKDLQQWFPIANTGYLSESFGRIAFRGIQQQAGPAADATHATAVLMVYVVGFIVISAMVLRSRDVTN
jgi:ABC-type transport system involved in multi-copper enzyme maturation permease subunit